VKVNDYDSFGAAYSAENEVNLINRHYERPAMLDLLGDVRGRRILDAGCGSGPLAAALLDRGAVVTGFDSSAVMVGLARKRLGEDADVHVADLSGPIPFADGGFDDVTASLVLHYLRDWTSPLSELRRVLRRGGRLVLSVNHPLLYKMLNPQADYFAVTEWTDEYSFGDQQAVLTYWHRPLHDMTDAFSESGFRVAVVSEPAWSPDTPAELLPPGFEGRTSFVSFLFFVLVAS
jgi:SAM-dependent methyltransferase